MASKLLLRSLMGIKRSFLTAPRRPYDTAAFKHLRSLKDNRNFRLLCGASFIVHAAGIPDGDKIKNAASLFESAKRKLNLKDHDPESITQSYLIQMASHQTLDSVSALLTQVSLALVQAEKEYAESVQALTKLMKGNVQVLDVEQPEERTWDLILECRARVNKASTKQQDLQMLMAAVEKVVEATAEVTILAGTEEASTVVCERLYRAQSQVLELRQKSLEAEERLRKVEAASVEAAGKQPRQSSLDWDRGDHWDQKRKQPENVPEPAAATAAASEKKESKSGSEGSGRQGRLFSYGGLAEMEAELRHDSGGEQKQKLSDEF